VLKHCHYIGSNGITFVMRLMRLSENTRRHPVERRRPEYIIQAYLDRVSHELQDLPTRDRDEILDDLREHIHESAGPIEYASEADIRNILERLGHPQDVANEASTRHADPPVSEAQPEVKSELDKTPGALEVAAIILTALFWPIGVLLAWISQRWKTRDKVIATIIPFVATIFLGVIVLGGLVVYGSESMSVSEVVDEPAPAQPGEQVDPEPRSPSGFGDSGSDDNAGARLIVVLGFLGGVIAGPFVTAVYLAVRLQPIIRQAGARFENSSYSSTASTHSQV
jgi:uncharacterized membrane protein